MVNHGDTDLRILLLVLLLLQLRLHTYTHTHTFRARQRHFSYLLSVIGGGSLHFCLQLRSVRMSRLRGASSQQRRVGSEVDGERQEEEEEEEEEVGYCQEWRGRGVEGKG